MTAAIAALMAGVQTPAPRACQLCDHRRPVGDTLHCAAPLVAGAQRTVPCELARRWGGGCGPEADHLQWPRITGPVGAAVRRATP